MNIMTPALQEAQISFTLPTEIPAPKFHLFQRVSHGKTNPSTGVITGIRYVDFTTALIEGLTRSGWFYRVNIVHGLSQQEILNRASDNVEDDFWEKQLIPADPLDHHLS